MSSATQRAAAREASRPLAREFGQLPERIGPNEWKLTSRRPGEPPHRVLIGLDGEAQCICPGFENVGHCWAATRVKEYVMVTEESTALVPIKVEPPRSILPSKQELNIIGTIARTVVGARGHAVPASIDSPAKAAAVMLAGHELGVKPMTALRHIFVVNGRTEPDAQIMAGIVTAHEPDAHFEIVHLTASECTMRLSRPSKGPNAVWEYTYTIEDAEKAKLLRNDNWDKYPKDMLRYAATKRLCRAYAPDLINSVGTVEVSAINDLLAAAEEDAELQADEKRLQQADLYNEGDTPYTVDAETGEIIEPPAPVTDATYKRLNKAWGAAPDRRDAVRQRFPQAFPQSAGGNNPRLLSEAEALEAIALLEAKPETPVGASDGATKDAGSGAPSEVGTTSPACQHEYAFNEDTTLMTCGLCGQVENAPPAEQPAQAALMT